MKHNTLQHAATTKRSPQVVAACCSVLCFTHVTKRSPQDSYHDMRLRYIHICITAAKSWGKGSTVKSQDSVLNQQGTHTCTQTHTPTHPPTHTHMYTHTQTHPPTHPVTHIHVHTHTEIHTNTSTRTLSPTHTHIYVLCTNMAPTCTHSRVRVQAYTHIRTHILVNLESMLHVCTVKCKQHTASLCDALQHTAIHCDALQHAATRCNAHIVKYRIHMVQRIIITSVHPYAHIYHTIFSII